MKKNTGNKIGLGIFVSAALALFIIGIYCIGSRQQLFGDTFVIRAVFKDIDGLQIGNNVRFVGITIGTVDNIEIISDSTVRVDMVIESKTQKFIKKNAKATIGTDGLMGNKVITITAGTMDRNMVEKYDYILTTVPIGIDDILKELNATTSNATQITNDLAVIINNIRSGKGTVGKLFMDNNFANNVNQTLVNMKQGTDGFKENMEAAKDNIFLRGFFKKKKREKEKNEKEEKEKEEQEKKNGKKVQEEEKKKE